MDSTVNSSERHKIIARIAAVLVAAGGLYIIYAVWWPMLHKKYESYFDFVFLFIFPIPASVAGVYLIYVGKKLWGGLSDQNTRQLAIVISAAIVIFVLPLIDKFKPVEVFTEEHGYIIFTPVLMICGGLFYLRLRKTLFDRLKIIKELNYKRHVRAVKIYFGFLALTVFSAISRIADLAEGEPGSERGPPGLLVSLIMLAVAVIIYRVGVSRFTEKAPIEDQSQA